MIHNDKGLTLLEVLVSMIILTVGILGLAPMIILSSNGNIISRDVSETGNLVKERIEFFENLEVLPALPFKVEEAGLAGGYTRISAITDNTSDSTIPAGMAKVQVGISWTDQMDQDRRTSFTTFIDKG